MTKKCDQVLVPESTLDRVSDLEEAKELLDWVRNERADISDCSLRQLYRFFEKYSLEPEELGTSKEELERIDRANSIVLVRGTLQMIRNMAEAGEIVIEEDRFYYIFFENLFARIERYGFTFEGFGTSKKELDSLYELFELRAKMYPPKAERGPLGFLVFVNQEIPDPS